jgi:DNA-binding GntR family transcriptional regulator
MPRTAIFQPVELPTLKRNVADLIEEAILSGKVKPGERLNESQLSRDLRVSRAPIREALQQLEKQGLVINRARRGMFVVHLDSEDAHKINSVRVPLEAQALTLARERMTPQAKAKVEQALDRLERSENATPAVRARLDFEFHRTLWALTGNEYLERTLETLTAPMFANAVLRNVKAEKVRIYVISHRPLFEYVTGATRDNPVKLVTEHVRFK